MKKQFDNSCLDMIVPIKLEADWESAEVLAETMRFQKEHYGITRFALGAPSIGWKTVGYPPMEHFDWLAEKFIKVRDAVKEDGISCGFLNMLTILSGDSFGPIIRADGTKVPMVSCPLDPDFRKAFAESNARLARIAQPDFMMFEDDYGINAQTNDGLGCFCDRHLHAFAQRCGRLYTRQELVPLLQERTQEGIELLRKWRELMRDSMVELSQAVRQEVDKYAPQIPIGTMQPSSADRNGDMTEAVARALAGPNHTPFSRLYGTVYGDISNAKQIPEILQHSLYSRQHIRGDFCFYHESDTYPHTRYFISARKMRVIMASAFAMGFDGATHQTVQILDDKNEETAYGKMYKLERKRYNASSRIAKQCRVQGVQIVYDPFLNTLEAGGARNYWTRSISLFGIPYTTLESQVAFWDRRWARYADHETVMRYLSKGLFLDSIAAMHLCRRGYGKYIGVEIGEDLSETRLDQDHAGREVILPPFDRFSRGKNMWLANQDAANRGGGVMAIRITDPRVETITEYQTFRQERLGPAMVRFENDLGGRIVVLGMTLEKNVSGSLLNYRRHRLFHELVKWCGGSYAMIENEPNIYVIMNQAVDCQKSGFKGMLTLSNLGEDPVENTMLYLPAQWRDAGFKLLDREGQWQPVDWERTETGLIIADTLDHCDPMYILVE